MNEYDKIEAIKRKAIQFEEKARMKEKLLKVNHQLKPLRNGLSDQGTSGQEQFIEGESIKETMEVNDMYIDAIQAKLKILDQI